MLYKLVALLAVAQMGLRSVPAMSRQEQKGKKKVTAWLNTWPLEHERLPPRDYNWSAQERIDGADIRSDSLASSSGQSVHQPNPPDTSSPLNVSPDRDSSLSISELSNPPHPISQGSSTSSSESFLPRSTPSESHTSQSIMSSEPSPPCHARMMRTGGSHESGPPYPRLIHRAPPQPSPPHSTLSESYQSHSTPSESHTSQSIMSSEHSRRHARMMRTGSPEPGPPYPRVIYRAPPQPRSRSPHSTSSEPAIKRHRTE